MRRFAALALVVTLGLMPAAAGVAAPAAEALAALAALARASPQELTARLKSAHKATEAALKVRRERFDAWQSAVEARDEAAARVERMKLKGERGEPLDKALRQALVLDEKANLARSQLMAAEAQVARQGAELLAVYDALLTVQRRDADGYAARDPRREKALAAWQALAAQRDRVRRSLGPVLRVDAGAAGIVEGNVAARPDDDVETLLEKADLARDLEERFLRRAEAVQRRIAELVEERSVARDVAGLVHSQALFDEDDMRLRVVSSEVSGGRGIASPLPGGFGGGQTSTSSVNPLPSAPAADSAETRSGGDQQDEAGGGGAADPGAGAGAPPPAPPADADDGAANQNDFTAGESVGASPDASGRSTGLLGSDVAGTALPRVAERAFSAGGADVDIDALLTSGELSLPELRALEKKLRQRAADMHAQSKALKDEVKGRGAR